MKPPYIMRKYFLELDLVLKDEMSSKVYFILSGEIYIMSKDGNIDYGVLSEGSYFGDISVLLG